MAEDRLSRRRFLRGSALAGIGAVLGACGAPASPRPSDGLLASEPTTAPSSEPPDIALTPTGPMTFANRRAAIDLSADGSSPTLASFEEAYGVEVHYANGEIEDDAAFVAALRPQLELGVEPGWDLVVLSDPVAARVIANGWAERIDPANVGDAVANLRDDLTGRPWDPDQEFHYPWLSWATGIAWHRPSTGRDLGRIEELFAPELAGRVSLLRTARDTLPMIHLLLRARGAASDRAPAEMTRDDAAAAIEFLRPFVDSGHVRAFTTSEHVTDLADGTTAAALAPSRGLASAVNGTFGFAYPAEGWLSWSDNLVIPRAARHRYSAELLIDWVYDPARSASLASFVEAFSPIDRFAEALAALEDAPDPDSAGYTLLVPPATVRHLEHPGPTWDDETAAAIDDLFTELTGA